MIGPLYKFLRAGAIGPFSGHRWPTPKFSRPGDWQKEQKDLEPCVRGIHVCRPGDLAYWMSDELYEIEVQGVWQEHGQKLVVERARLVARVESWPEVARQLAERCVWHVRDLAARELEIAGLPEARELMAFGDYLEAERFSAALVADRGGLMPTLPAFFLGFLVDAVEYVTGASSSTRAATYAGQVAAYAADRATPESTHRLLPGRTRFSIERERQAEFIIQRIGLPAR